jgi:hypothetical protein
MLAIYTYNNKVSIFPIEYISKKLNLDNNTSLQHFVECKDYITNTLNNYGLKIVKNKENTPLFDEQLLTLINKKEKNEFTIGLIKKSLFISSAIKLNPDILFSVRVRLNPNKNNNNLNATVEYITYIVFRSKDFTEEDKNKIKLFESLLLHKESQEHFSIKKETTEDSITICLEPKYFDFIPEGEYSIIEMF